MPFVDNQSTNLRVGVAFHQMTNEDMEPADCFAGLGLGDQDGVKVVARDAFKPLVDFIRC